MKSLKSYILLIFLSVHCLLHAADKEEYAVSKIPLTLITGANAVKRYEEIKFQMISLSKCRWYKKVVITVLNENGDKFAQVSESYDRLRSIETFEGKLYDALGNKIKSVKKSDIQDVSGTDAGTLADDSRIKAHSFYYRSYPYTVEYETELQFDGSYIFPYWFPIEGAYMSVQESNITVKVPSDYTLRYKVYNLANKVVALEEGGNKIYKYEQKNILPVRNEVYAPDWTDIFPAINFSPTKFEFEGYQGDLSSWKNFGNFQWQLNKGRDQLPVQSKTAIHQIADTIKDVKLKVQRLYEYMQQHTRYISIQLGIGGLQPFDANFVATKKYGDCKALSNYMYAILKEAGIKSCYTIIGSGERGKHVQADFPADYFNHIILAVPLAKDTMWLECTSQTMPAGYLGDFTNDRYALMVDEDGGKLVRTPKYNYLSNTQRRKINATIDAEGNATIQTETIFKAMAQDDLHGMIHALSKEKVKEFLNRAISLPQYELMDYQYRESNGGLPEVYEHLTINATNFATVSGKRIFVTPNMFSKTGMRLTADTSRKYDLLLDDEYQDVDSVVIQLPNGYQPESLLQPIAISSKFGKYKASVKVEGNTLIYYRFMERYSGRFAPADYNEFVKFYEQIYKADRGRVVMVKAA